MSGGGDDKQSRTDGYKLSQPFWVCNLCNLCGLCRHWYFERRSCVWWHIYEQAMSRMRNMVTCNTATSNAHRAISGYDT